MQSRPIEEITEQACSIAAAEPAEPRRPGAPTGQGGAASARIDRWLTAVRWFKSRSQAQHACEAGHVSVNGVTVKSSRLVQVGDEVTARAPRGLVVAVVQGIEEKRQCAVRARELYEDRSPPQPERSAAAGIRPRGQGRPTKAERRAIERLLGVDDDSWDE